ncbi:FAD-binding oxidoreductase [Paramaledivibacter caminithermalis]|jgi:glycolate oxidase|uniref:Glycolate oxidase n=1 Tax=Paramaledivibacter caminithermalis (strain DSM 15212 / CIP 107654 / DViRD3) TaxID=1121301 RepID=A0A1M6QE33_PARC5|nr:FAD-binding oxidoreductase [Paramaledivibacter caminithermalis]SHK18554.1 glycolate oxidase [Paramaledivibacter caminithermalis DSM 15212]
MKQEVLEALRNIVGSDWVVSELDQTKGYLYDETELLIRPDAAEDSVVVKPRTPEEICEILKYANEEQIVVVPRGGGTGLCGAAIPTETSIILSMERFKDIIEIDNENLMITVEAGVTLSELIEVLKKHDKLYFPIHPGDESAHIAGMVIENAGGARAVKHGIMRSHIRGVEVVLPTGEILNLGGKLTKNNAGYNLLQLIIGSEGTLGVVTKVTLKLYPEPKYSATLVISFDNFKDAVAAVPKILQEGITPLAIEYVDRVIALEAAKHIGEKWPAEKGNVDLIFMLSESKEDTLYDSCMAIEDICRDCGAIDSLMADNNKDQQKILAIRSNTYTATKHDLADSLDITVPPAYTPDLMNDLMDIAEKYNTKITSVGHIGDGNLHNNILLVDGKLPLYYEQMKEDMYKAARKYGGTITGEHGVGKTRMDSLITHLEPKKLDIMRGIKQVFDPNNILNPNTIFYTE